MLHSGRFTAIQDANVLYPAPLRDFLLSLAAEGLYSPKWSTKIQNEWTRNVLKNRSDIQEVQLIRTIEVMDIAFPDAQVTGYQSLVGGLTLPDANDRHILAAAIRCNAEVIVTDNTKDFPKTCLEPFDIEAQRPDVFISNIIDLDSEVSIQALQKQVARLKNPRRTIEDVLSTLEKNGLVESVATLRTLLS